MEIVNPPTYANFLLADFPIFRKALLENLPNKRDNRSKLSGAASVIRVKANDYNFYELPLVFLGGIGKENNESDNDNLAYYWNTEGSASQAFFLLVALGGARELWLGFENRSAKSYADYQPVFNQELHAVLGISVGQMANTGNGTLTVSPVKVTLPKPAGFNFQTCSFILGARVTEEMRGVYESDYYAISIPRKGQDPHGVVIPSKWQWPTETTSITNAYPQFAAWAHDIKNPTYKNWYMSPEAGKVVNK